MEANLVTKCDLIDIDKELKSLWDQEQGKQHIRAALFTLIVYTQNPSSFAHIKEIVKHVVTKFPCRVLFICVDPEKKESLQTSVSAENLGEGSNRVFCEFISISLSLDYVERIPFLVTPHILPDLPVHLLWTASPSEQQSLLDQLATLSSRVIFDPTCQKKLSSFCQTVIHQIEKLSKPTSDLTWSRLAAWRRVLAQTFRDQTALKALYKATHIIIDYGQNRVEGEYLIAWLASRLHWNLVSREGDEICYNQTRITLKRSDSLELSSFELINESSSVHYRLIHDEKGSVRVEFSDAIQCSLPVFERLSHTSLPDALIHEIFYPSSQSPYLEMLNKLISHENH